MSNFQSRFASNADRGLTPAQIAAARKHTDPEALKTELHEHTHAAAHEDPRRTGMSLTPRRGGR